MGEKMAEAALSRVGRLVGDVGATPEHASDLAGRLREWQNPPA